MIWVFFLTLIFIDGYLINKYFLGKLDFWEKIIFAFIVGSITSVFFIYLLTSYIFKDLITSIVTYFVISLCFIVYERKKLSKNYLFLFKEQKWNILLFFFLFSFSLYFFSKGFSYDSNSYNFLISSNTYLDFGAHIPFIRSFSMGNNFPAEVPFSANSGLIYHFMFNLYAGILEFLGLRIDLALNLISAFAFIFLLIIIYKMAEKIFNNKLVSFLSVFLLLFNSSLSIVSFFQKNGFNLGIFSAFWNNSSYITYGPLGFNTISVFWTMNAFLNQRHLIFGLLFGLSLIYLLLFNREKNMKGLHLFGFLLGFFVLWHTSIFLSIFLVLIVLLILKKDLRKKTLIILILGFITSLSLVIQIKTHSENSIIIHPGFLMGPNLDIQRLSTYWIYNLGLGLFLMIYGFLIAGRDQKKIFLAFFSLFLFANIFQIGKDIYDNHKLFNFWIIIGNIFIAYGIVSLLKKNIFLKIISLASIFVIFLSGMLSLLVIKNDVVARVQDYQKNKLMTKMLKVLPNNFVVVTNGEIYDPASIIGKKVFLGRVNYIFLYGGSPSPRIIDSRKIYCENDFNQTMELRSKNRIGKIIFYKNNFAKLYNNCSSDFLKKNFKVEYEDNDGIIFKI